MMLRNVAIIECEDLCCACIHIGKRRKKKGDRAEKTHNFYQTHLTQFVQEWPQLGPHDSSFGLHQANKFWC